MTNRQTRQKIFREGLDLLGEEGFAGLTLGTLATRAGLSKSGLFAHFKSKTDLENQLIEEVLQQAFDGFIASALKQPKGLRQLTAFFEGWLGWTCKAGIKGGCPIAAGLFELDDMPVDSPTRVKLQSIAVRWNKTLLQICEDAVATGELAPDLDKKQFLFELYGIYFSHHVSSRFNRNPKAGERAKKAFARLIRDNQKV